MKIRITGAKGFKRVTISGERAMVGEVADVSEGFVHGMEAQFPSFEFEVLEVGESHDTEHTGNDNNDKEDETA